MVAKGPEMLAFLSSLYLATNNCNNHSTFSAFVGCLIAGSPGPGSLLTLRTFRPLWHVAIGHSLVRFCFGLQDKNHGHHQRYR